MLSDPSDRIGFGKRGDQPFTDATDHGICDIMAVGLVDQVEIVEVESQDHHVGL